MKAPVKCPYCSWWTLAPLRYHDRELQFYCWVCRLWVPWQAVN